MKLSYGIACAVVNKRGQILLLKRSPKKKLFPGKWFVVGAYPLKEDADFQKVAENELIAELGVGGIIEKEGTFLEKKQEGVTVRVKPFLAHLNAGEIKLNEEHTQYRWIYKEELASFDLVSGTMEMIRGLLANE